MNDLRVSVEPLLVRRPVAEQMLGGRTVLDQMERRAWLAPVHRQHRMTLYSVEALRLAAARLAREELFEVRNERDEIH